MVDTLSAMNPPQVGVTGPTCNEGATWILTHDMVHRTHLDIFDFYYPPLFTDWWLDDWISAVYTKERTKKLEVRVRARGRSENAWGARRGSPQPTHPSTPGRFRHAPRQDPAVFGC